LRVDVVLRGMDVAAMTECAVMADMSGEVPVTLWLPESPGDRDPFVTAAALLTRTRHVRVGTGVVPIPLRSTVALAAAATTLEEIFPGRFDLGVGTGNVGALRQAGVVEPGPPLAIAERFLAALGPLRSALPADVTAPARPPVYLAAHNRRMIDLAARRSDGVILNAVGASDLSGAVSYFRASAAAAGTNPAVGMYQLAAFGPSGAAVRAVRRVLAGFLRSPAVRRRLSSFGSSYASVAETVAALSPTATDGELAVALPDEVVHDFGVTSDAALRDRLRLAHDLGLNFVALSVFPAPLRLRKPFPPIPEQGPALEATMGALAAIARLRPVTATGVSVREPG
jgi:alkanesulfonate monooxygenase SsuD/methylene tetrahydromethanopterin reductase-like flavin-dependent oxidoreductase (luciferase family)